MPLGPPKPFRTWPTVASPQAQKRLDDDAEMILWLMGLSRQRKAEEGEDITPEGSWERPQEPKPQQGWERPRQASKVPGHAAYPGLFQGLLYEPPGPRGLLDLDPHEPFQGPMPAWPAPGASGGAAQFANSLRLAAETGLRPAVLSLSNPGSPPPEYVGPPRGVPQVPGAPLGSRSSRDPVQLADGGPLPLMSPAERERIMQESDAGLKSLGRNLKTAGIAIGALGQLFPPSAEITKPTAAMLNTMSWALRNDVIRGYLNTLYGGSIVDQIDAEIGRANNALGVHHFNSGRGSIGGPFDP